MKFYDLFAGIGGFRLGLEQCGHKCVGSCEIDKYARIIYGKHFEEPHLDATKLDPKTLPDFDMLTAGFPCQTFSIAGQRKGFDDTRGTIFFEIARIARECKPKYLFLENVKDLLNHDKGQTFKIILETMDELGYDVEWQVLNTKYFLPQNRERVFIIGHSRGRSTRKIFPLGQSYEKLEELQPKAKRNERGISNKNITALDSSYYKRHGRGRTLIQIGYIKKNLQGNRVYDADHLSTTITAEGGGLGAKTGLYRVEGKPNIYNSQGWLKKDSKIRRLTPLECERLQGFPDGWTEGISDTQRYKCVGNAVSVPVVKYIGENIETN